MKIVAKHLTKAWPDGQPALRDFSADFKEGEITALIGRNGSGKTTLLRLLAGLLQPDNGSVSRPPGPMGFLFQQNALWPHLTVRKQLELCLRIVCHEAKPEKRAIAIMEKYDVAAYASRYPMELSGGQQQRVAIARCMCVDPVAVLLDEITNSLDPAARYEIARLIEEMRTGGRIVIVSTHDLAWARLRADRAIYLNDGMMVGQGRPEEVMDTPCDPFFAGLDI